MNNRLSLHTSAGLIGLLLLAGCQTFEPSRPVGRIERTGLLAGFPDDTESSPGVKTFFEPSAVILDGEAVLIANDKPIPGRSPVLTVPIVEFNKDYIPSSAVDYVDEAAFEHSSKIEAFAGSAGWNLAVTDFSRVLESSADSDTFNNLIAWPRGRPDQARILHASTRDGVVSSRELRPAFREALASREWPAGPPYFKVEGLASPDSGTLLFGIREIGADYEHSEFCFILLRAPLGTDSGAGPTVGDRFIRALSFRPVIPEEPEIELGLSSVEYDPETRMFCATTSREDAEHIGAYVWVFSHADLANGRPPRLVHDANGRPLALAHKAEGLVPLGGKRYLVVCDDDRILKPLRTSGGVRQRKPNEAPFFIISIDFDETK